MPCDEPLTAWAPKPPDTQYVFQRSRALNPDNPQSVPCGRCMGCRLDKAGEWADRACHEAQLYQDNCICTLTFEDEHLPKDGSIRKIVVSKFMRRLRDSLDHKLIRFMACGEYGDLFRRPHYHIALFNHTFPRGEHWSTGPTGVKQYKSPALSKLWPWGLATFADFTRDGAAYVGRYATKKQTIRKDMSFDEHPYIQPHPVTGELHLVEQEFLLTSRRPGLGFAWLQKNYQDVVTSGHIMRDNRPASIPRYYDKKIAEAELHKLKLARKLKSAKRKEDRTPDRRKARALIRASKMSLIKR